MNKDKYELFVVGINHKTASISDRELFQISKKEICSTLNYFKSRKEVEGVVIISTCNRVEFYLVLQQNSDPFFIIKEYFLEKKKLDTESKQNLFYTLKKSDVAKHLFRVVSGLESVVLGEYQIQGQIKDSYSVACSEKTADKILHKLFHAAFRTGKSVRNNTFIGSGKQSLSGVAFQAMKESLKKSDEITIVGVNENTKIIAKKLYESGFVNLNFVNRTLYKAAELAEKYNGTAYSLDQIDEPLSNSKCLFSCTGSPQIVIASNTITKTFKKAGCLKLIVDMSIPRDIDTNGIAASIKVLNLEGLKKYLSKQKTKIESEISSAERIINAEANLFEVWSEAQQDDVFAPLAEKIEQVRQQLLDETSTQFSEADLNLLDKFSRSLVHRLKATVNQVLRSKTGKKKAV